LIEHSNDRKVVEGVVGEAVEEVVEEVAVKAEEDQEARQWYRHSHRML
jgi:hypothetical protein